MGKLILLTSGKGGSGKSSITCGLGAALCRRGNKVLLVDMDEGLRTLDLMLGLASQTLFDLSDVYNLRCSLAAAVQPAGENGVYSNLFLLPAPLKSGDVQGDDRLAELKHHMAQGYDYVLIDSPAGLDAGFMSAAAGVRDAVIVVTPDPVCVRIASTVRETLLKAGAENIRMLINKFSRDMLLRRTVFNIDEVIDETGIQLIGIVPYDKNVQQAASLGTPLEGCAAARAFDRIAARLDGEHISVNERDL